MNEIVPIVAVVVLSAVGVLGDYFIKLSGNGPKYIVYGPFLLGAGIYALTAIGWFYVMKHLKFEDLGMFYSLSTVIFLAIVGAVFFKEQLTTGDIIGICFGVVSIIILARFG